MSTGGAWRAQQRRHEWFQKKGIALRLGSPLYLPKRTSQPSFTISKGTWMLLGSSLVKPLSSSHCCWVPINASWGERRALEKHKNNLRVLDLLLVWEVMGWGWRGSCEGKRGQAGTPGTKAAPWLSAEVWVQKHNLTWTVTSQRLPRGALGL